MTLNLYMRSVRLFLAGRVGSFSVKTGMNGFCLAALLFSSSYTLRAQNGRGTNGGAFSFATNKVAVSEKDGTAYLVVTRNSEVGKMLVDVSVKDGTATNNVDFKFAPATNTITFSNLQTAVTIPIAITDNSKTNSAGQATATFAIANPRAAADEDPRIKGTVGKTASS
ncbi:MAG TPA: Calx-beta domain-containing protein, partial [Verrucomicrobiae bacterium]|nr:Calx-beta domain-containing protein [Verrucomicrobiae bacterium]